MVFDLSGYKSHPNKSLLCHVDGVRRNVNGLTNSKLAELVTIFHDIGKMNPNFQDKLLEKEIDGYDKHSYLSAFVFFCVAVSNQKNRDILLNFLEYSQISTNDIVGITTLIAKHHGNIPNFCPIDYDYSGRGILSKNEVKELFAFVSHSSIPFYEYVHSFFDDLMDFTSCLKDKRIQDCFADRFVFQSKSNLNPLDNFLDLQFSFASVIQSDKADAACFDEFIESQRQIVNEFSKIFPDQLDQYLQSLNQYSAINKLRTEIRNTAVSRIQIGLSENRRVFELTAPTGSGKTLMLLSLASEIIKNKGAKRIIYGLPFLSITEQVEAEVIKIFSDSKEYIQRIDSKSENKRFEDIQKKLENNHSEDLIDEMNLLEFQENTFSYPFIVTTFVRFFETLLSNRNSELIKLPNFSHCIFLLDEIQALPPRLYGFFVAYLSKFCEKYDSYAIVSTATQPNFSLPDNNEEAKEFFFDYKTPKKLLPLSYFNEEIFNRYKIQKLYESLNLVDLKELILLENKSVLVILNTIDDTKKLFELLLEKMQCDELILLNTHFTPKDRKAKIALAKNRLEQTKKIVVISTQLIEAGVDIDFPILYRDMATVASIVQSAGRCNRNGKLHEKGKVVLFDLKGDNGKLRSELIYRGKDKDLIRFTRDSFIDDLYQEKNLLNIQKSFFKRIQSELHFAKHWKCNNNDFSTPDWNFMKDIKECMYEEIGKFQLIEKQEYGEECQYYVAENEDDDNFELLLEKQDILISLLHNHSDISEIRDAKKEIEIHLKKMANQIVQIRLKNEPQKQALRGSDDSYFDLWKINLSKYSFSKGVDLEVSDVIL